MTDYRPVYTDRGRLSYIPDHLPDPHRSRRTIFQNRSRRPHRIHIANVAPDPTLCRRQSSKSYFNEKLAGPRENAKRFLRSIINANSPAGNPHVSAEERTSPRSSVSSPRGSVASSPESRRWSWNTAEMRTSPRNSMHGSLAAGGTRPGILEGHRSGGRNSAKSSVSSVVKPLPEEKPVASGNGINVGISLTEPVLFLQGFEQTEHSARSTAMLRGSLQLRVTKAAKIKAITLKFRGKSVTKWPEGIPPKKVDFEETDTIMSHTWPFFNAQFPTAETSTGADHVELAKAAPPTNPKGIFGSSPNASSTSLSTKEAKRLSLQVNQSRSFGKGESSSHGPSVAQKGYRTFNPGAYVYNFELPLDSHLPETIDVELGSVKYELEATVERAGAFRANLMGAKEVMLIRSPAEGSLEQVEPIAISRSWEDQLHYDIVISGKSFPLGAQVPIAFKLTPLAKVQCHRIKVFVTENVEYFCSNKRVHRMEPVRKVLLFEKRADGPPTSTFPGSTMRIVSGGGVSYDQRAAAARGETVAVSDPTNLLGNLGGDSNIGPTEMEFNVQLPSCHNMKDKDKMSRLHFDTTYQNIQVHHWIKIVMRLSKPDAVDPTKRRHFEISIDSPFHILSCQATQANTALPAYSSPHSPASDTRSPECGCPGAAIRRTSPTTFVPTLGSLSRDSQNSADALSSSGLARPQQAHIGGPIDSNVQRPIHLMRVPSFNPPAFEDEEPPPPLETPPPLYESIASPTSGLADYFSRLSDAYDEDSGDELGGLSRGRVEIPLTPGSRINSRSLDERRTWLPVGH
ncbi:hypothetical protein P154DRAFT_306664 [Amniculicola lignicola CBS 123094]|uniref:Arrestin C-terminal-like domain-containing protein n=1 Tax=Amniculicola lignicola CBS 123094 TaxID=1392246 RepID=A0A6A5WCD3_9PLEO|nr:hypothetical protein P154DRAFT_306664 [Amniculicola lignicola CBS 123094]